MKKILISSAAIVFLCVAAPVAHADVLDQQEVFSVSSQYDYYGRSSVDATLKYISSKAYFYIEDDFWNQTLPFDKAQVLSGIQAIGTEFDNVIYPTEVNFFGTEPNPGIDGDGRITILVTPLEKNVGGYFDSTHEFSQSVYPESNEREMLIINSRDVIDQQKMFTFFSHEFQHLISYNQKEQLRGVADDIWLNELRSEYAITLTGNNDPFAGSALQKRAISLIENPQDSLTEWKNMFADYGQIALLAEYIAEHWSPRVIADTLQRSSVGVISMNEALQKNGFSDTFERVYGKWLVTNLINDPAAGGTYHYTNNNLKDLRIFPTEKITSLDELESVEVDAALRDWEPRWYDLVSLTPSSIGNNTLKISVSSSSVSSFTVVYMTVNAQGQTSVSFFKPTAQNAVIAVPNIGSDIRRVAVIPFKHDRLSGFTSNEPVLPLTIRFERVQDGAVPTPTPNPSGRVTPEQFGLQEGDFIRANGDNDIYIVNAFGYKRLVLSPEICRQYGHLGRRGCFDAVKIVTTDVRDAFVTSHFYTNGETHDGVVYQMIITGEDSARLVVTDKSSVTSEQIFLFNTREQNRY